MSEYNAPEGWALVPVEPTLEMVAAMAFNGDVDVALGHATICQGVEHAYAAMLAAAPAAPTADGTTGDKYRAELYDEVWQRARDMGYGNVTDALVEALRNLLPDDDIRHLRRFQEICEDTDADGHDLPKEAVRRLERAGALRSCGFGRHETTLFGDAILAALAGKGGER